MQENLEVSTRNRVNPASRFSSANGALVRQPSPRIFLHICMFSDKSVLLKRAAGGTFNNVVKCTVLLQHMSDFSEVNDVYKEFFTSNEPARAAYQVAALPRGALIEIEAVAVIGNIEDE